MMMTVIETNMAKKKFAAILSKEVSDSENDL